MAVSRRAERNREDAEQKSRPNGDSFMVWRDER
jgi:hypothetical protein